MLQDFVNVAHEAAFSEPYPLDAVLLDGDVQSLVHTLVEAVDYSDLVENEEGFLHRRLGETTLSGCIKIYIDMEAEIVKPWGRIIYEI